MTDHPERRKVCRVDCAEPVEDKAVGKLSPLTYAQLPVLPLTESAAGLLMKLEKLARREDGLAIEGAWNRLVRHACRHTYAFRPYLVNAKHEPATIAEIAKDILFCDMREAKRLLGALEEVGLIEWVDEPDWAARDAEGKRLTRWARRKKREAKPEGSGDGKTGQKNATVGARPGAPGKAVRPSEEKEKRKGTKERNTNTGIPEGQPPATTNPKESEAGQSHASGSAAGGSALSVHAKRPKPDAVPLGHSVKLRDFDAESFGLQVFEALGLDKHCSAGSREGKSERGSFANWLLKAKAQNPPEAWPALRERGIEKARYIAKHGRTAEKPGAVWHKIMGNPAEQRKAQAG